MAKRNKRMTPAELQLALRDRDNTRMRIQFGGSAVIVICSAIPILAMYPAAKVLAGKHTVLGLSISLFVSLSFVGLASVLGVVLKIRESRYKHDKVRLERLRHIVHELRARLRAADLDDSVPPDVQKDL